MSGSPSDSPVVAIERAFRDACRLDVAVRKPGNVSHASPGHRMTAALFDASAAAASGPLCRPGEKVGARIEAAMKATWAAAGCNTNLGILLLCAPVAAAAERLALPTAPELLRATIGDVVGALDRDDAAAAFHAIALANPAGLGSADEEDVHAAPTLGLREAMVMAADRDSVARQYRDGYADLFGRGLAAVAEVASHDRGADPATAVQRVFLALLAAFPDSHIERKWGGATARIVQNAAVPWAARAAAGERVDADPAFAVWDEALKAQGINPGTTADLTAATLMIAALTGRLPAVGS